MKRAFLLLSIITMFSSMIFAKKNTSGKIFFNHSTDLGENGINAFNMKRAYLSYGNSVSDNLSYKVTYDMGSNKGGSAHTAFLKVAMVKWNAGFGKWMVGMQGMNMFKTMENTWGHRFIAKMPMDTYKFSASADVGVGFAKTFGPLSTSALITNGGGYKSAETDKHKKISIHTVYGETKLNKKDGFNAGLSYSREPYDAESGAVENTNVMGVFAGYAGSGFRGGLEFDTKSDGDVSGQIICLYGTYQVSENFSVLGRIDQYDADTDFEGGSTQSIIAGVHYSIDKGFTVAPTFRMKAPEGGDTEKSVVVNFQFNF